MPLAAVPDPAPADRAAIWRQAKGAAQMIRECRRMRADTSAVDWWRARVRALLGRPGIWQLTAGV